MTTPTTEPKSYTVHDVLAAECNLEPMRCLHCGNVGEVTFHQYIGDASCAICGRWQLAEGPTDYTDPTIKIENGVIEFTLAESVYGDPDLQAQLATAATLYADLIPENPYYPGTRKAYLYEWERAIRAKLDPNFPPVAAALEALQRADQPIFQDADPNPEAAHAPECPAEIDNGAPKHESPCTCGKETP